MDISRILSQLNLPTAPRIPIFEKEYDSDDSIFFNDPDDSCLGLSSSLSAIGKSYTKYLNYSTAYVSGWGCHEAFRESYQNWRDGILKSANLDLSQFETVYTEKKRVVLVQAREPSTEKLLGSIRFQYDKDGLVVGGLKMANFNASLPFQALGTGATSKANDSGQTGQHGEGMKLSALVYRRNNYNFRIESSGFKWNFIFKRGEFACRLSRIGDKSLAKMKAKAEAYGQSRGPVAHPWEDVCVVIGAPGPARTASGKKVPGARIHVDTFKAWLKVTLDINAPAKMINTNKGDLIRDPNYKSRMYLRGLLLPGGGMSRKEYGYGYNFNNGSTGRDRHLLAGSGEESKRIASIWAAAIRADDAEDSDIVYEYTDLLLKSLNVKGDAILSGTGNRLPEDVAKRLWTQMLKMSKDTRERKAFYYCACEGKDDVQIIEQSFGMNPVPLDQEMWNMLKEHKFCRTPADELLHRFNSAGVVPVPKNTFGAHVSKMLRSLIQSAPAMENMKLTFVNGKHLKIDAGFFGDTWRVHSKWLTSEGAHEHTFCETFDSEEDDLFSCDHAVLQLWDILLAQLIGTGKYPRLAASTGWLKSMARGRLAQMPRSVKCAKTDKKGELFVSWKSVDSYQHRDKEVKIVLHVDTCTEARSQNCLRSLNDDEHDCGCPSQLSQSVSDGVTFLDLKLDQEYLPSVSRNTEGAFIALPPRQVKPRTNSVVVVLPEIVITSDVDNNLASTKGSPNGGNESLIDLDDDVNNADDSDDCNISPEIYLRSSSPSPSITEATSYITDDFDSPSGPQSNDILCDPPVNARSVAKPASTPIRLTIVPTTDTFILGRRIEQRSLDWGGNFPGSHDFYRTGNAPNEDIFILKPKAQPVNKNGKRVRDPEEESRAVRFKSKQPRCEDAEDDE